MRDCDIRGVLLDTLGRRFVGDRIRSELGLCLGATRVDVAVINGSLHGYEIKSARDTLARLATQVDLYGLVLDYATIVAGGRHVDKVADAVPQWWGVQVAFDVDGVIHLEETRPPARNAAVDPLAVAQLLWRDEAAAVLTARGERVRSKETRWALWDRLAELPVQDLQAAVRGALKARPHWPGG